MHLSTNSRATLSRNRFRCRSNGRVKGFGPLIPPKADNGLRESVSSLGQLSANAPLTARSTCFELCRTYNPRLFSRTARMRETRMFIGIDHMLAILTIGTLGCRFAGPNVGKCRQGNSKPHSTPAPAAGVIPNQVARGRRTCRQCRSTTSERRLARRRTCRRGIRKTVASLSALLQEYLADGRNTPATKQANDVKINLRERVVRPAMRRKEKQ